MFTWDMESNQMMEAIDKMPGAGGQEDLGLAGFAQLSILCLPVFRWPKYTVSRSTFNINQSRFDSNMFQASGYPEIQSRYAF